MGTRDELDILLRGICPHTFFQPTTNTHLSYPCIIYELNGFSQKHADNQKYYRSKFYNMLYITKDPEDSNIEKLADLSLCSMGKPYTADGLYHYPYTIYF